MTNTPRPGGSSERLGVVGTRQLIAVQTLDIARLTAHPVAIIPETFVAVTGMGPSDSNESGKTSFLSAVALLLGDPEWRVTGTGAANVEALLFEPITAGASIGFTAATEGYIVGVFGEPEEVEDSLHTVWMKISSAQPYLKVRHGPGLHLARGADDHERHMNAPSVYRSLRAEELGSTEYARVLYGRSPRVLAYVASRGRVRSRPSLLKLDAGTFTPEQIGEALISLTGRASLLERDQQDRRNLVAKREELEKHVQRASKETERENEILRQVSTRNRLRELSSSATVLWLSFRARAVLDAYAKADSAGSLLEPALRLLADLRADLITHEKQRVGLKDQAALRLQVETLEIEFSTCERAYTDALGLGTKLELELDGLENQLLAARIAMAGHDLGRDGTPEYLAARHDELAGEFDLVVHAEAAVKQEIADLQVDVEQAGEGQFGFAGLVVRELNSATISSVALAEATSLSPETRMLWEARLAPWRHLVCVSSDDLPKALEALKGTPGAVLIASPASAVDDLGGETVFPEGILAAPPQALQFLRGLAEQKASHYPVPHAVDARVGVHAIGGFEVPIIGRETLMEHLNTLLRRAESDLEGLRQKATTMQQQLIRTEALVVRAEAARLVIDLRPKISALATRLARHRNETLPPKLQSRDDASEARYQAKQALIEREERLARLAKKIRDMSSRIQAKEAEVERLKLAARPDDAALAAWDRGRTAARAMLRWPLDEYDDRTPDQALADEASPPAVGPEEPDAIERRRAVDLAQVARSQVVAAVTMLQHQVEGVGGPPRELHSIAAAYLAAQNSVSGDQGGRLFEQTLTHLEAWLDDEADRDDTAYQEVDLARAKRADATEFVSAQTRELEGALTQTQQAIVQRASSALEGISQALNILNQSGGGLGARLEYVIAPPSAPDQDWKCRVTPRWRRNPGGPELSYDNVTNTAQEKVFSIHLVLAALLAAPHPRGRVLILDELADSLGAEHRREVLSAVASVAEKYGITVLGTCQDSIMREARPHCRQILYFHYPSKSMPLNRPTRIFGFDRNGARVELMAEAMLEGRGPE